MSSNNTTKKRKVASDESGISLAAVLAEMQEMKSKLSRVGELESRCISMQNEMDGMKSKLSRMDDIKNEMDGMRFRLSRMDKLEKKYEQQEEKCQRQEEKCNILEDRCDSLQRSIEILSDENKWEYSAPPVPNSHWTSLGFDEEYIEYMEELLSEISYKATLLREGEFVVETITFGESSDVSDGIVLQHDAALLPHWREFANALQLSPDSNIKLTIQNVQLTSSVIDILIPSLKGKLTDLFLYNNGLVNVSDSVEFAVKCIKSNRQMNKLYLTNNQFGNMKNTTTVFDAVISHPSIERIRLDDCLGGGDVNGYDALCYLFATNKRWLEIDFDNNSIQTNGGTAIQDYIASNPPLEYLYLASNKLNDNDATLIASALKGNTNLRVLRLENNNITDTVNNTVEKAVYDTTSLNCMADCNNTCKIRGIDFSIPCWYTNCNDSHQNPKWLRAKKIYGLLSIRNEEGTNVQYLNDKRKDDESLTLKLVPKVLDCIYKYYGESGRHLGTAMPPSKYIPALSIIYEILRGWKMPELYDTKRGNVSSVAN